MHATNEKKKKQLCRGRTAEKRNIKRYHVRSVLNAFKVTKKRTVHLKHGHV